MTDYDDLSFGGNQLIQTHMSVATEGATSPKPRRRLHRERERGGETVKANRGGF